MFQYMPDYGTALARLRWPLTVPTRKARRTTGRCAATPSCGEPATRSQALGAARAGAAAIDSVLRFTNSVNLVVRYFLTSTNLSASPQPTRGVSQSQKGGWFAKALVTARWPRPPPPPAVRRGGPLASPSLASGGSPPGSGPAPGCAGLAPRPRRRSRTSK